MMLRTRCCKTNWLLLAKIGKYRAQNATGRQTSLSAANIIISQIWCTPKTRRIGQVVTRLTQVDILRSTRCVRRRLAQSFRSSTCTNRLAASKTHQPAVVSSRKASLVGCSAQLLSAIAHSFAIFFEDHKLISVTKIAPRLKY